MAFIRPYKPSDFEAAAHICRATLPPSLSPFEPANRLAPYLWTHQYTLLSPSTCFVLDDGSGLAVGYCIGCPDIPAFVAAYPSYHAAILDPSPDITRPADLTTKQPWNLPDGQINEASMAQMAYSAHLLLLEGNEDLLGGGYKATMHIDLLDEWQGKGWGKKLIDTFVESVRNVPQQDGSVSKGIWIGVAGDNSKVVPFYEKQGFQVKDRGLQTKSICMTRDF